ncbi:MAG TPA: 2-phospho-L-lactate guanylyltransferase [Thermoleophilaceae bacterium]|nr:2-phospho-L-lactate guanylyltransferase [Thermoleophilaceae bacterium]
MRTIAILPVKSFAAAKQRLAEELQAELRHALARAMLADVLRALRGSSRIDELAVVSADPVAKVLAREQEARVLHDDAQAGQSPAADVGIRHALAAGFERALLVPGDTPLLDAGELDELLAGSGAVAIVPDRHGAGTNALVLAPPDAIEPSFGPGSFERHLAAAERAALGHSVERVPTLMLDVDTPEDLARLEAVLERLPGERAPATRQALGRLERARASAPHAAPASV